MSREAKVKKTWKFALVAAVLAAMSMPSAFADSRPRNETDRGRSYGNDDFYRGGRERQRYGYNDEYVRGVVERVDYRRGTLVLRDDRSGRRVRAFMAGGNRGRRGVDLNDLRRGDVVTLTGDQHRNGVFEAYRIESVRSGRW
jgi:hypothetical protein